MPTASLRVHARCFASNVQLRLVHSTALHLLCDSAPSMCIGGLSSYGTWATETSLEQRAVYCHAIFYVEPVTQPEGCVISNLHFWCV
jgi:hypothetical protein